MDDDSAPAIDWTSVDLNAGFTTEDPITPSVPAGEPLSDVAGATESEPPKRNGWPTMKELRSGGERRRTKRTPKPVPPKPREGSLVKPLTEFYAFIGVAIVPFDQVCGTAVVENAEQCARALENLARENPAMRRVLLSLVETSVWGQVIAAHMPIAIAIASHHVPAVRNGMGALAERQANANVTSVEDYLRTHQNGDGQK